MVDEKLSVFPVSKSTHMLFIAGTPFERFSKATGVTYDSLSTWDGFLTAAEKYYEYSGGKSFCALDFPIRAIELNAMEQGAHAQDIYTADGWYNFENEALKASYVKFAEAIAKGHIIVSDLYSNTQIMTGEVVAGLGSTASILYYNDTVTYPDNTSEPMNLQILPPPTATDTKLLVTQAGVGLCAYKTTEQKSEAAAVFARWLTDAERNLDFCVETGYMPVNKSSFDKISDYSFKSDAYKNLYSAIEKVNSTATAVREPSFVGYYNKIYSLYDYLRTTQKTMPDRYKNGESAESLAAELWEADCSGAFVMLEVQVNSQVENAATSRAGIYLQRNSLELADTRVLLYRGIAKVGKDHNCMPHRKWRLEFSTELFPNYDELKAKAAFPLNQSYRITDVVLLPGTDQHVMLMTVPLLSEDGTFYGICGFELNEGYFKQIFAQPSELDRALFCISKSSEDLILSESTTLSAGIVNKYYLEPYDNFTLKSFGSGLTEYCGENETYIGVTKEIRICPDTCTSAISVLIPKSDYERIASADILRIILLIIIFSLALVALSLFFSRRFLRPVKNALDSIRKKKYSQDTAYFSEITDLFAYLAEQDKISAEELDKLRREKAAAVNVVAELQTRCDETEKQNQRLAYSRKDELDPYDYDNFKNGIKTLTEKEKQVLNLYIEGKNVKDIMEIMQLQESTIRFHNRNIYSKLGVHSLKQLLRCAAILKQESMTV